MLYDQQKLAAKGNFTRNHHFYLRFYTESIQIRYSDSKFYRHFEFFPRFKFFYQLLFTFHSYEK